MKISIDIGITYKYQENYLKCNVSIQELPVDTTIEIREVTKGNKTVKFEKVKIEPEDIARIITKYREELRTQVVQELLAQKVLFKQ